MDDTSSLPLVVVALGGNAIQDPRGDDSVESDLARTAVTAGRLAEIAASGRVRLVVTHGNGPQVGNHLYRSELAHELGGLPNLPLDVCVADTQGGMGYVLQQCLTNALHERGVPGIVASLVTQVIVAADDPAFDELSKPIGEVLSPDEAERARARGWALREEQSGGGFRRVVASPNPLEVVEAGAIDALLRSGVLVVAGGGGGVPVVQDEAGALRGVPAVVDKDLASALLAGDLRADVLLMLTDVEGAYTNYGRPDQQQLAHITVAQARRYLDEEQFGAGSMGPKVEAACRFVEAGGGYGVIASLARAREAVDGEAGTVIRARP